MINNPITNKIVSTIEKEIYQDFENFIKSVNVPKNGFRTIHPKTILGQLSINIPRTRGTKSEGTTYLPDLCGGISISELVDKLLHLVVNLFSTGNTFKDIRYLLKESSISKIKITKMFSTQDKEY